MLANRTDRCILVNVMDEFQEWKTGCTRSLALLKWWFLNCPWVTSSELPLKEAAQMWCFTAVTIFGQKKDIRVSNVSRVLLCFLLTPFGPLWNMKAPNPCHFTCIQWRKCDYEHVLICPHTLFALSYRTRLLLASPSHFQSNKNTVQRPQHHWPCTGWKVESSCWQANYRPLSRSTPWTL